MKTIKTAELTGIVPDWAVTKGSVTSKYASKLGDEVEIPEELK